MGEGAGTFRPVAVEASGAHDLHVRSDLQLGEDGRHRAVGVDSGEIAEEEGERERDEGALEKKTGAHFISFVLAQGWR